MGGKVQVIDASRGHEPLRDELRESSAFSQLRPLGGSSILIKDSCNSSLRKKRFMGSLVASYCAFRNPSTFSRVTSWKGMKTCCS
jgi:hypothetical protein